jgi:hypothetical protein
MENNFTVRMNGEFHGILRWTQLDDLWGRVRAEPEGWYVSLAGEVAPMRRSTQMPGSILSKRWMPCSGASTSMIIAESFMPTTLPRRV